MRQDEQMQVVDGPVLEQLSPKLPMANTAVHRLLLEAEHRPAAGHGQHLNVTTMTSDQTLLCFSSDGGAPRPPAANSKAEQKNLLSFPLLLSRCFSLLWRQPERRERMVSAVRNRGRRRWTRGKRRLQPQPKPGAYM